MESLTSKLLAILDTCLTTWSEYSNQKAASIEASV